jgi:hypothetical protein
MSVSLFAIRTALRLRIVSPEQKSERKHETMDFEQYGSAGKRENRSGTSKEKAQ